MAVEQMADLPAVACNAALVILAHCGDQPNDKATPRHVFGLTRALRRWLIAPMPPLTHWLFLGTPVF